MLPAMDESRTITKKPAWLPAFLHYLWRFFRWIKRWPLAFSAMTSAIVILAALAIIFLPEQEPDSLPLLCLPGLSHHGSITATPAG